MNHCEARIQYLKVRFTILPYYSTALFISKNFHILPSFNVNQMGSHWVLFLLYLNIVLNGPEDGRLRPKHVAKYNLILIIASCLAICCVLTVHNILYKLKCLTLILLTWRIWWASNNASRWKIGFNSAFKELKKYNY